MSGLKWVPHVQAVLVNLLFPLINWCKRFRKGVPMGPASISVFSVSSWLWILVSQVLRFRCGLLRRCDQLYWYICIFNSAAPELWGEICPRNLCVSILCVAVSFVITDGDPFRGPFGKVADICITRVCSVLGGSRLLHFGLHGLQILVNRISNVFNAVNALVD